MLSGDKPICFYSGNISDFTDPNPQLKWIQLNCDLAIGKVTDINKAGLLSLKISIHDKSKDGPINFD